MEVVELTILALATLTLDILPPAPKAPNRAAGTEYTNPPGKIM